MAVSAGSGILAQPVDLKRNRLVRNILPANKSLNVALSRNTPGAYDNKWPPLKSEVMFEAWCLLLFRSSRINRVK